MTPPRPITVLDGGMGRELMRIGAPFRQPEWSALALLDGPDWVVRAHRNFIDAGAEVITTNSYAVVPFHLGDERFAERGRDLAELSGRLAREAADQGLRPVRVAGSLPPLFGSYRPDLFDAARAPSIIDPLVDGLAAHVDVWLGETLGSIVEARAVREAIDRAGHGARELWISYTLDDDHPGTVRSGETVVDAARAAVDLGASTVMFNCCQAETITVAIDATLDELGDAARVGGYANRFVATHTDGGEANAQIASFRDDLDPSTYGEFVQDWLARGATVVGGCCGMQPEHIARVAQLVAGRR
jgi:S-methylmethionine-dependent homocysteine/selenocysteine methylase